MKYDGLIEAIDEHTGILQVTKYDKYYLCFNPFSDDTSSRSASIWRNDGAMQVHNSSRTDGLYENRYSMIEWIRQTGCVDIYIRWICKREGIITLEMRKYEDVIKKQFSSMTKREKGMLKRFKDIFHKKYFLKIDDVLNREKISGFKKSDSFTSKKKTIKTDIKIYDPLDKHKSMIEKYMEYRGIPKSSKCFGVTVEINNFIKKPAVCFLYPNGFRKLRFIGYWDEEKNTYVDSNKKFKFMANSDNGSYEELYEIRKNWTDIAIVCEGETEGYMLEKYFECDIFTLHNAVAVADRSNVLSKYKSVFVFVDLDRYMEIKDGVHKAVKEKTQANVRVLPKFGEALQARLCEFLKVDNIDFNSLYILSEPTLKKIFKNYNKCLTSNS